MVYCTILVIRKCCSHHMFGYHLSCLFYLWEGDILNANIFDSLGDKGCLLSSYSLRGGV